MSNKSKRDKFILHTVRDKNMSFTEAKEDAKKVFGEPINPHLKSLKYRALQYKTKVVEV